MATRHETQTDAHPPELRPMGALMLVLVLFAAFMSVLVMVLATTEGNLLGALNMHAAAVVGLLMALYVGLNRYAPGEEAWSALRLGRPDRRRAALLPLAAVAGFGFGPVANDLTVRIVAVWPAFKLTPRQLEALREAPEPGAVSLVILFVVGVLVQPALEEAFFRGFLQPRMQRSVGVLKAIVVTLVLYVAFSANLRAMPAAFLLAAPMGILAWRSGCTWVAICGHAAFQLAPRALPELGFGVARVQDAQPAYMPFEVALAFVGAAVLAVGLAWRLSPPREEGAA